jgi:hypothetical protein
MRDKNDGKSLDVFTHVAIELPKFVEKLTALLCYRWGTHFKLLNFWCFGDFISAWWRFGGIWKEKDVASLVALVCDAFLQNLSDDWLHKCLFEDE